MIPTETLKDMRLQLAYELYKRDWCKTRGFSYASVQSAFDKGEKYRGCMFKSLEKFADCEYQDRVYIDCILSKEGQDWILNEKKN